MSVKHAGTYLCRKPYSWVNGQGLRVNDSIVVKASGDVFVEGKELEQNRACLVRLTIPHLLSQGWIEPLNLDHYNMKDNETMIHKDNEVKELAGAYLFMRDFHWPHPDFLGIKAGDTLLVVDGGGVYVNGGPLIKSKAKMVRRTLLHLLRIGCIKPVQNLEDNTMSTFDTLDRNLTNSPTIKKQILDKDIEIIEELISSGKTPSHAKLLAIVFARAYDALEKDRKEAHRNGQRKAFQCLNQLVAMVKKLGEEVENGAMLMTQAESQALFNKLHEAGKAEFEPLSDFNKGLAKLGMATGAIDVPEGLV